VGPCASLEAVLCFCLDLNRSLTVAQLIVYTLCVTEKCIVPFVCFRSFVSRVEFGIYKTPSLTFTDFFFGWCTRFLNDIFKVIRLKPTILLLERYSILYNFFWGGGKYFRLF
jgi:hypothetical protein